MSKKFVILNHVCFCIKSIIHYYRGILCFTTQAGDTEVLNKLVSFKSFLSQGYNKKKLYRQFIWNN